MHQDFPDSETALRIYIRSGGLTLGPAPIEEIRALLATGMVKFSDAALYEGGADWQPLCSMPEFGDRAASRSSRNLIGAPLQPQNSEEAHTPNPQPTPDVSGTAKAQNPQSRRLFAVWPRAPLEQIASLLAQLATISRLRFRGVAAYAALVWFVASLGLFVYFIADRREHRISSAGLAFQPSGQGKGTVSASLSLAASPSASTQIRSSSNGLSKASLANPPAKPSPEAKQSLGAAWPEPPEDLIANAKTPATRRALTRDRRELAADAALDSQKAPFGSHDVALIRTIQQRWLDRLDDSGIRHRSGKVVVSFREYCDGHIADLRVKEIPSDAVLTYLCRQTVLETAPHPLWPAAYLRRVGQNYREMQFTFNYQDAL